MPECESATTLCHDYHEEIKMIILLEKTFPGRIKIVRYEDLNTKRRVIMAKTYKFLNITLNFKQLEKLYTSYQRTKFKDEHFVATFKQ